MLYALVNGIKELPKKGLIGICPVCEEQLIPKCGTINIHHWAHKKDSECEYRNDNDMCQWHKDWQNLFDKENQEVIIKKNGKRKMADVYINGMTIEFQHSYISNDEIKKRENHYDNLIWIFDFTDNNLNVKKNIYDDCSILILDMKYNMRLYYDNNKKFRNIPKDKLLNVIETFDFYENLKNLIKKWEDEENVIEKKIEEKQGVYIYQCGNPELICILYEDNYNIMNYLDEINVDSIWGSDDKDVIIIDDTNYNIDNLKYHFKQHNYHFKQYNNTTTTTTSLQETKQIEINVYEFVFSDLINQIQELKNNMKQ